MECPRGSPCTESSHEVKTMKTAVEWFRDVTELQLPIQVNQQTALNGRVFIKVHDKDGNLLTTRG